MLNLDFNGLNILIRKIIQAINIDNKVFSPILGVRGCIIQQINLIVGLSAPNLVETQ